MDLLRLSGSRSTRLREPGFEDVRLDHDLWPFDGPDGVVEEGVIEYHALGVSM